MPRRFPRLKRREDQRVLTFRKIPVGPSAYALVDNQDYVYLSKYTWYCSCGYAVRLPNKRKKGAATTERIRMHNEILGIKGVDHKNRNKLDNRRQNLRPATQQQNLCNRETPKSNRSGYKGVSEASNGKKGLKWRADIRSKGLLRCLGYFKTRQAAAAVYNKAAKKLHGEFAVLNIL